MLRPVGSGFWGARAGGGRSFPLPEVRVCVRAGAVVGVYGGRRVTPGRQGPGCRGPCQDLLRPGRWLRGPWHWRPALRGTSRGSAAGAGRKPRGGRRAESLQRRGHVAGGQRGEPVVRYGGTKQVLAQTLPRRGVVRADRRPRVEVGGWKTAPCVHTPSRNSGCRCVLRLNDRHPPHRGFRRPSFGARRRWQAKAARVSSRTTAVNAFGSNTQSSRTDMGSDSAHCRTFTAGNTRSTRCAAVSAGVAHEPTETMPQQPALQISLQRPLHERGHGAALCLSLLQKPGQPGGHRLGERRLFRPTAFALARRRAGRMSAVHIGSSDTDPACRRAARTSQAKRPCSRVRSARERARPGTNSRVHAFAREAAASAAASARRRSRFRSAIRDVGETLDALREIRVVIGQARLRGGPRFARCNPRVAASSDAQSPAPCRWFPCLKHPRCGRRVKDPRGPHPAAQARSRGRRDRLACRTPSRSVGCLRGVRSQRLRSP